MTQGFWANLPKPLIGLSPMDGVTDQAYRFIMKKYGQPDLIMTEFTSAEGISHNATKLFKDFLFDESQRPIVAQIFGKDPEAFRSTALILGYLGFDGIDINMGCPAKNVQQNGSGAALIQNPDLAGQLIQAVQAGIQDFADGKTLDDIPKLKQKTKKIILERHQALPTEYQQRRLLPVSVKTRVGYDQPVTKEWISFLLKFELAAISLHGRTLKQMYTGAADWSEIGLAVQVRDAKKSPTLIIGNGDIDSVESAKQRLEETKVDGWLIGRATYGNPQILRELRKWRDETFDFQSPASLSEPAPNSQELAVLHSQIFEELYPSAIFWPMRKHLAWYIKGMPGAAKLREQLMQVESAQEVEDILKQADILS